MITIDPAVFRPESIAPETRAINEQIESFLREAPSIMDLGPEVVRKLRREGQGILAMPPLSERARWETAKANGLEVPVRIVEPEGQANGVYMHIHGGGHTLGGADMQDPLLTSMADAIGCAVVSVDYRLAPENPWPAPADDCEAAAVWLFENAKSLFGTDKIAVGGESAGGHLSAVTILRMRDKHDRRFTAANLVYGVYDLTGVPSLDQWGTRNLIINTPIVYWFGDQLLPPSDYSREDKRSPELSPLHARLDDLCPALFSVGTLDPILDDTLFMAPRWLAAGNETALEIYPGGIHAFDMVPGLPIAEQHHRRVAEFLKQKFS